MTSLIDKLNKALKGGSAQPKTHLIHEDEVAILNSAKKLLIKSAAGTELLEFAEDNGVSMHVLRNKEEFGVLPEQESVFIACPAGQTMPTTRATILLAGALREAMQEITGHHTRPKTARIGKERFIAQQMDQQKDRLFWQTVIVHELYEATGLLEIVDEFAHLGYGELYMAYQKDLENNGQE